MKLIVVKTACTTDDVYYLYGECYFNNDNELVQDQYPVWNTPHTCNDNGNPTPNYSNITNPCCFSFPSSIY